MSQPHVMRPGHARWSEFAEKLSRSCICFETTENARQVLSSMAGIDVERSLETLRILGGSCDCEIVFGIAGLSGREPMADPHWHSGLRA